MNRVIGHFHIDLLYLHEVSEYTVALKQRDHVGRKCTPHCEHHGTYHSRTYVRLDPARDFDPACETRRIGKVHQLDGYVVVYTT